MPRVTVEVTMDLDRSVKRNARYLCASLEEGIANGWFDFLLDEEVFPAKLKSVNVHSFREAK